METSHFVSSLLHFGHHSLLTHYKPHKYAEQEFPSCDSPNEADNNLWASSGEAASFQIDDLLDLPNEELVPSSPSTTAHAEGIPSSAMEISAERAGEDESAGHEPESGLCIPPDELVSQLEWLSGFNEDNFFSGDARYLSLSPHAKASPYGHPARSHEVPHEARDKFHSQSPVSVLEQNANSYALSHLHKPNRARKARTGGRVWSLEILKPISTRSRLKVRTGNTGLLAATCTSAYTEHVYMSFQREGMERSLKKAKKNGSRLCAMDSALVRRCSHCLVQKTPQWRAGPLGPKTLCNACGVRYKSGRLVPEYRPAASPTFVNEVHSNSHRRILEMRRVKEMETDAVFESNKYYANGGLCPLGNGPNRALEACEENLRVTSHIEIGLPVYKQGNDPHLHDHQCKMHDDDELSSQGSSSSCKLEKAACRGGSTVMQCSKEAPEHDTISPRQPNGKEGLATIAGERVSLEEVQASQRHELVSLELRKATIIESRKDQDICKDGCDSAYAEEQKGCKWPGLHETA